MADETKIVTISDVKKLLEKEEKARELSYEQRLALEHAKHFTVVESKPTKKLIEKLKRLERINASLAAKIVEIFPKSESEVRAIFAKERFNLEPDEIKEILNILGDAK